METKKIDKKDDITTIEQTSISTYDFHSKSPPLMSSIKNQNFLEFPDEDFNFDDCDIIINKIKESQRFFTHLYIFSFIFNVHLLYLYIYFSFNIFQSTR